MSKVYIVQDDGSKNFSKAKSFGNLIPLFGRSLFPDDLKERLIKMEAICNRKLLGINTDLESPFDPHKDYILLTGDPACIAFVIAFLTNMCVHAGRFSYLRILKWDGKNSGYYIINIPLGAPFVPKVVPMEEFEKFR